jgi:hypothetical protein
MMIADDIHDDDLAGRLKRLDASAPGAAPSFGYETMIERAARRKVRARRRLYAARATAGALVVALVGASIWRFEQGPLPQTVVAAVQSEPRDMQPRIVRADTYFAVAALEDHIASVDDALSIARAHSPRGAEVARLERTRDELLDSYSQVRYAQMVSANF